MPTTAESDDALIHGNGTAFTTQLTPRMQIMLPKSLGFASVEVTEVIDDQTVRVKKQFTDDAKEALLAAGKRRDVGKAGDEQGFKVKGGVQFDGIEYKVLPYIDQTKVCPAIRCTMVSYSHIWADVLSGVPETERGRLHWYLPRR